MLSFACEKGSQPSHQVSKVLVKLRSMAIAGSRKEDRRSLLLSSSWSRTLVENTVGLKKFDLTLKKQLIVNYMGGLEVLFGGCHAGTF